MKKLLLILLITTTAVTVANAQVAIKPAGTGSTPDASAMLDVQSTNKGVLLPRMTAMQRLAISNPATGLMVYDTDSSAFMIKNATGWVKLQSTTDILWKKNGNNAINTNSENVGIGTSTPTAKEEIVNNSSLNNPQIKLSESAVNNYARLTMANNNSNGFWTIAGLNTSDSSNDQFNIYHSKIGDIVKIGGKRNIAMGASTTASNYGDIALGFVTTASGGNSLATGRQSQAKGLTSTAMGEQTTASGAAAVSMGAGTIASGGFSTATGAGTRAAGENSTAMGYLSRAKANGAVTIGSYNDTLDSPNSFYYDNADRIFQIGNGNDEARKNAVTILRNGNSGFGVLAPKQVMEIAGAVKIADTSNGVTAQNGTIRYNTAQGLQVKHNNDWKNVSSDSSNNQWATNGNSIYNKNSGNVGVGTNTPTAPLQVSKDADVWHSFIGGNTGRLQVGGQTANGVVLQSWNPTSNTARDIYLQRDGGNVAIGTNDAKASLNVAAGKTVLFGADTISDGAKLWWIPSKGAFRVGYQGYGHWDNVGIASTALGNSGATANSATAMGTSVADSAYSTAMGYSHTYNKFSVAGGWSYARGIGGTAFGYSSADGAYSTALGSSSTDSLCSTAFGYYSGARNKYATAMGYLSLASGESSIAGGDSSQAVAKGSTAFGKSVAKGNYSSAMGWSTVDSAYSTAMGYSRTYNKFSVAGGWSYARGIGGTAFGYSSADGAYSTALGSSSTDSLCSTAFGYYSGARNKYATAMGYLSLASGESSIAGGDSSIARGKGATAFGKSVSSGNYSTTSGLSNAQGIYSTAFGTSGAQGDWAIAGGDAVAVGIGSTAFGYSIAGGAYSTALGSSSTDSLCSTAFGYYSGARNKYATAMGYLSTASGESSVAGGDSSQAIAKGATAFGKSVAKGNYSIAMGMSTAKGDGAIALGNSTADTIGATAMGYSTARNIDATAMGYSIADGYSSTSMGRSYTNGYYATAMGTSYATAENATAMGRSIAKAIGATAMGNYNWAKSIGSTTVGGYNDTMDMPNQYVSATTDRIFQVGNGNSETSRSNAITVLRNGNTGVGVVNPVAKLDIAGQIKISGGSPATGKVLTSDANGLATWQNAADGNFTANGNNTYQTNADSGTVSLGSSNNLPTTKLSIVGNAKNPNGLYVVPATGGAAILALGKVGVNTLTPDATAMLDINGQIKISGGSPAINKVLTSDANGLATWQAPATYAAGSGININSNTISTIPQTLSISGNQLSLSNSGGTVTLPGSSGYTGGAGIVVAGSTINALHTSDIWNANKLRGNNVSTNTPTTGQVLTFDGTDWTPATPATGGSGSSQWTTNGNDINNNNTGKILMGNAPFNSNPNGARFQLRDGTGSGGSQKTVAAITNATAPYTIALNIADSGTSGGPISCSGCQGNAAIKAYSAKGDVLYGTSQSRGMYLKAGSAFYPAMQIDTNGNALALQLNGQLQITAGNPGAGKVLTSDENGIASWQAATGGGSSSGWGLSGNSGNTSSNFIGNTDAVDFIVKTNNTEDARFTSGGALLVTGSTTNGTTPTSGAGTRMMWVPAKGAFRAGTVTGTHWNDIQLAAYSTAFGYNTIAAGNYSFAVGNAASATGFTSFAIGDGASAGGARSFALGSTVNAGQQGSFCFGDMDFSNTLSASSTNQMNMRFSNGYRLFTNSSQTIGVSLAAGGNSWSSVSDVRKKENFVPVNGEDFLKKIAEFKLTSWNYIGQNPETFRHYGPMAQDFYKAFGKDKLGTIGNDTTIASADFDGINLIAIQALEKRTITLKEENARLQYTVTSLNNSNIEMQKKIEALELLMQQILDEKKKAVTVIK